MKAVATKLVLMLCLFLTTSSLVAQDQRLRMGSRLPRDAFLSDFQLMSDILKQAHPGMYLHTSKEQFADDFAETVEKLRTAGNRPSLRQFFLLATEALDPIRCGHTYLLPPPSVQDRLQYGGKLFPIPIKVFGNKFYVDHRKTDLPFGTEIISINDRSTAELLSILGPLVSQDGFVESFRETYIEDNFSELYAIRFGFTESFDLQVRRSDQSSVETISIPAKRASNLYDQAEPRASREGRELAFRIDFPNDSTAFIAIDTFDSGNGSPPFRLYKSTLKKFFSVVDRHEDSFDSMIIDLRYNDGGYTRNEMLLYSYLTNNPFAEVDNAEILTSELPYKQHLDREYVTKGLAKYYQRTLSKDFEESYNGTLQISEDGNPIIPPNRKAFDGKIYVLIGGRTYSAGSSFCSRLKAAHPNVEFIGEETGGASGAFTAGTLLMYTLPNSRCKLAVPIIRYQTVKQTKSADRGVMPDYPVKQTLEDFRAGKDTVLQAALELVKDD